MLQYAESGAYPGPEDGIHLWWGCQSILRYPYIHTLIQRWGQVRLDKTSMFTGSGSKPEKTEKSYTDIGKSWETAHKPRLRWNCTQTKEMLLVLYQTTLQRGVETGLWQVPFWKCPCYHQRQLGLNSRLWLVCLSLLTYFFLPAHCGHFEHTSAPNQIMSLCILQSCFCASMSRLGHHWNCIWTGAMLLINVL